MIETMPIDVNVRLYSREVIAEREGAWEHADLESLGWKLEDETHNLVVTSGKILVARMLMEESGWDTGITFCDVGTDDTAVTVADTDLNTGTKRNAITVLMSIELMFNAANLAFIAFSYFMGDMVGHVFCVYGDGGGGGGSGRGACHYPCDI